MLDYTVVANFMSMPDSECQHSTPQSYLHVQCKQTCDSPSGPLNRIR